MPQIQHQCPLCFNPLDVMRLVNFVGTSHLFLLRNDNYIGFQADACDDFSYILSSLNQFNDLLQLARPEGFEPPTPRFVVWYSIQLSYGRIYPVLANCPTLYLAIGGEGGIRTLDGGCPYSLSRGAPSAARPPLQGITVVKS